MRPFWTLKSAMHDRRYAESAERNVQPILEILRHEFQDSSDVLEIGSGTGQHAVRFACELGHLQWQTSDLDENHASIRAWVADAGLPNVRAPISLDVTTAEVSSSYNAVFSSNTAHIMSFEAVVRMFALVAKVLHPGGVFCLYGPFRRFGEFNTESNAQFDASLRSRNPATGIRDLEELDKLGANHGLRRMSLYAVPSNNLVAVWTKTISGEQ